MNEHAPAAHAAVALGGATHTAHDAPHAIADVSLAHALPHAWNPAVHVKPHVPLAHVAMPLVGVAHGEHALPQFAGSLLLTQLDPHA
jgi:hypothetical protein